MLSLPFAKPKEFDARVVAHGGCRALVLSFQTAVQPVVWRVELSANPDLRFQVLEQEGVWALCSSALGKNAEPIAQFLSREEADLAFSAARDALLRGDRRQIRTRTIVIAALVLFAVIYQFSGSGASKKSRDDASPIVGDVVGTVSSVVDAATGPAKAEKPVDPDKIQEGVPLPADDVLKPPEE